MVVRLPFVPDPIGINFEAEWLPRIAAGLQVAIPSVLGIGEPTSAYPLPWLVLNWLEGNTVTPGTLENTEGLARDLAAFITDMRRLDPIGVPAGYRCGSLHPLDNEVRECLSLVGDLADVPELLLLWQRALDAHPWAGAPVWAHCDLLSGDVLTADGRLGAILDFACAGVGDPACDLMAGWSMLSAASREIFRETLAIDDDEWNRGCGWALSQAAIALPYYRDTFPSMATTSMATTSMATASMATTSLHILQELGG